MLEGRSDRRAEFLEALREADFGHRLRVGGASSMNIIVGETGGALRVMREQLLPRLHSKY